MPETEAIPFLFVYRTQREVDPLYTLREKLGSFCPRSGFLCVFEITTKSCLFPYLPTTHTQAYDLTTRWLDLEPENVRAIANLAHYQKMLDEDKSTHGDIEGAASGDTTYADDVFGNYASLCRGEDLELVRGWVGWMLCLPKDSR